MADDAVEQEIDDKLEALRREELDLERLRCSERRMPTIADATNPALEILLPYATRSRIVPW